MWGRIAAIVVGQSDVRDEMPSFHIDMYPGLAALRLDGFALRLQNLAKVAAKDRRGDLIETVEVIEIGPFVGGDGQEHPLRHIGNVAVGGILGEPSARFAAIWKDRAVARFVAWYRREGLCLSRRRCA